MYRPTSPYQRFVLCRAEHLMMLRNAPARHAYTTRTRKLLDLACNSIYADAVAVNPDLAAEVKRYLTAVSADRA